MCSIRNFWWERPLSKDAVEAKSDSCARSLSTLFDILLPDDFGRSTLATHRLFNHTKDITNSWSALMMPAQNWRPGSRACPSSLALS